MIALFTNLFYFQRWSFVSRDPWQAGRHWWLIVMPVLGGLITLSWTGALTATQAQRYGLLETLRQYGREKLVPSGDAEGGA